MKKIENNFAVTGFVAKDAEVRQFTTTSVARFPLAVARQEKNGEETKRISAFIRSPFNVFPSASFHPTVFVVLPSRSHAPSSA